MTQSDKNGRDMFLSVEDVVAELRAMANESHPVNRHFLVAAVRLLRRAKIISDHGVLEQALHETAKQTNITGAALVVELLDHIREQGAQYRLDDDRDAFDTEETDIAERIGLSA